MDAILLTGGNIRGGTEYPPGSFFSLEALEAEIKSDEVVGGVVNIYAELMSYNVPRHSPILCRQNNELGARCNSIA